MSTPDPDVPDARSPAGKLLFDFRAPKAFEGWIVVNDNVMGGRSEGGFERGDEGLVFSGRTNADGGGFSSIRGPLPRQAELGKADGLTLRLRATGNRTFKVDLRQVESGRRSSLAYRADIPLAGHGDWEEIRVPFAAFAGSWRGERVPRGHPRPRSRSPTSACSSMTGRTGPSGWRSITSQPTETSRMRRGVSDHG